MFFSSLLTWLGQSAAFQWRGCGFCCFVS